jgi:hypothetical protein
MWIWRQTIRASARLGSRRPATIRPGAVRISSAQRTLPPGDRSAKDPDDAA